MIDFYGKVGYWYDMEENHQTSDSTHCLNLKKMVDAFLMKTKG